MAFINQKRQVKNSDQKVPRVYLSANWLIDKYR